VAELAEALIFQILNWRPKKSTNCFSSCKLHEFYRYSSKLYDMHIWFYHLHI